MHSAARRWVERLAPLAPGAHVLDVGGRNYLGSVRDLFLPAAASYTSIDLIPGPGVDHVCDFLHWVTGPAEGGLYTIVLYLEVAEHTPDWRDHIAHAADLLAPDGRFILTAAGPSRAPHNVDGSRPHDGIEHYANIEPADLAAALTKTFGPTRWVIRNGPHEAAGLTPGAPADLGDIYALARR